MKFKYSDIIKEPNVLLRKKSLDVELPLNDFDKDIINGMLEYLINSKDQELANKYKLRAGVGLAGVQVGYLKNIIVIDLDVAKDDSIVNYRYCLVNPRLVSHSILETYISHGEGCLSLEDTVEGYVKRYHKVRVKAYDMLVDKEVEIVASGLLSVVLQHELDHLKGVMYYDHINSEDPFKVIDGAIVID